MCKIYEVKRIFSGRLHRSKVTFDLPKKNNYFTGLPIYSFSLDPYFVTLLAFVGICLIDEWVPLPDGFLCSFVNKVKNDESVKWSLGCRRYHP